MGHITIVSPGDTLPDEHFLLLTKVDEHTPDMLDAATVARLDGALVLDHDDENIVQQEGSLVIKHVVEDCETLALIQAAPGTALEWYAALTDLKPDLFVHMAVDYAIPNIGW